jgi:hypothetical protein
MRVSPFTHLTKVATREVKGLHEILLTGDLRKATREETDPRERSAE